MARAGDSLALTDTDRCLLRLIADGAALVDMVVAQGVSPDTVRRRIRRLAEKLGGIPRQGGAAGGHPGSAGRQSAGPDVDPATGFMSRAAGERLVPREAASAARRGDALSAVAARLEGLGDLDAERDRAAVVRLVRTMARTIGRSVRRHDHVMRWGWEEFVVVLPGSDLGGARRVMSRLMQAPDSLTVSAGLSEWRLGERPLVFVERATQAAALESLRRQADRSLQRAARGR